MLKIQEGVTLISLTIAVLVILIITGIFIYFSIDGVYMHKLHNMQNDIENLTDEISLYYSKYKKIPAYTEYSDIAKLKESGVIGANDLGRFLIIELDKLEGITLNYGDDYKKLKTHNYNSIDELKDIYIINETSHNIFYVQGISINQNQQTKIYYTTYEKGDKIPVENFVTTL